MKSGPVTLIAAAVLGGVILVAAISVVLASLAAAADETTTLMMVDPAVVRWGFMSGALAAGVSALASGYAVAHVGSAAVGALAEKPELLGRVLVLVGLAEGIAIYGLIVAILIFNRLG